MHTLLLILSLWFTPKSTPSVHDFSFETLDGRQVKLSQFKGKKLLIVNTASKCGYTPQYEALQKLHENYRKKVVIIGFPAGNFGGQEFGTNSEIQEFCKKNYGVTFLLSKKVSVKGKDIDPLFDYLTKVEGLEFSGDIKWNFEKFLVNEKGQLVHRYRSSVKPMDQELTGQL